MANKLSWNPPKWKSYSLDGFEFKVELETGEVYIGSLCSTYIYMNPSHCNNCYRIFGQNFNSNYPNELRKLAKVLDLDLRHGNWPECDDVAEFLKRYYERVAKIEKSFTKSIISIESEINITPKFTI